MSDSEPLSDRLADLLAHPSMELVSALGSQVIVKDHNPQTPLAGAILQFFSARGRTLWLLKWAISKEVATMPAKTATPFRGTSAATRLAGAFYRQELQSYLDGMLKPLMGPLCAMPALDSGEVVVDPATGATNVQQFMKLLSRLIERILSSTDRCPLEMRVLLKHAQVEVMKKTPELRTVIVGAFLFLRFLCPALVAPEAWGLMDSPPSEDGRKNLVLVSRILQWLANGATTELPQIPHLKPVNEYAAEKLPRITAFFDHIANCSEESAAATTWSETPMQGAPSTYEVELEEIHQALAANLPAVTAAIAENDPAMAKQVEKLTEEMNTWRKKVQAAEKKERRLSGGSGKDWSWSLTGSPSVGRKGFLGRSLSKKSSSSSPSPDE